MGLGLILLKTLEYQMFSYRFSMDLYIGLLALFFALLGLAVGLGWFQQPAARTTSTEPHTKSAAPVLTFKEQQLLKGLTEGKTNQQLADAQHVSVNTVKTHLKSLYKKLEVTSRSEAVHRAKTLGVLDK